MPWADLEAVTREDAYRTIEAQPEFLFEHDGGPYGIPADLIYARLIGYDDQIVQDGWRLRAVEPLLRVPITQRLTVAMSEAAIPEATFRAAEYVLQSNYATTSVAAYAYCDDCPVKAGPPDFLVRLLYLRYRRRR